jgi:hypothetical protein
MLACPTHKGTGPAMDIRAAMDDSGDSPNHMMGLP